MKTQRLSGVELVLKVISKFVYSKGFSDKILGKILKGAGENVIISLNQVTTTISE